MSDVWKDIENDILDMVFEDLERANTTLFNLSQIQCPVDTGRLKASGRKVSNRAELKCETIYETDYANKVHEQPGWSEKGFKFLENQVPAALNELG